MGHLHVRKELVFMVYIDIIHDGFFITLNCHKGTVDGEFFQLVIDPLSKKVIKGPKNPDIDVSAAYSHIYTMLRSGEPLPDKTVAAWG